MKETPQQILYNMNLKDFRNKAKRNALYEAFAPTLTVPVDELSRWVTNMRSTFGRLLKLSKGKSGDRLVAEFSKRNEWIFTNFSFLATHVREVHSRQSQAVSIIYINDIILQYYCNITLLIFFKSFFCRLLKRIYLSANLIFYHSANLIFYHSANFIFYHSAK